jgi:muramoyltetrapeptide carboxypeptidase LdcA involved in peptidoglycan recycling
LVEGRARGPLVGGNVSMLAQTLATDYQIPAKGAVLFLEDAFGDEEDIEHALFHLKTAGVLDGAAGFVLGELSDKEDDAEELEQVFLDLVGRDRPVLVGMPAGHVDPNLVLPIGVEVEIDTSLHPTLNIVEAPLRPALSRAPSDTPSNGGVPEVNGARGEPPPARSEQAAHHGASRPT